MIVIVDYGMGNIGSIINILRKQDAECIASSDPQTVAGADKLILPGVGHFKKAMTNLQRTGLVDALNEAVVVRGRLILGICLGMQLITGHSSEGECDGLGWIAADTRRFDFAAAGCEALPVPHMGWNVIHRDSPSRLLRDWDEELRFYFVHTYHVVCQSRETSTSRAEYGYSFTASVERDNIFGVQFHPEKSHRFGMQIMKNFIAM